MGARVIAAASRDEKLAICRQHGADAVVNYRTDDLKERLHVLTERQVWGSFAARHPHRNQENLRDVLGWFQAGKLKSRISARIRSSTRQTR
jgi:NADPH:quinone reductase-like Zn-dependent oxidoreductase